jgi:hypothetical protein
MRAPSLSLTTTDSARQRLDEIPTNLKPCRPTLSVLCRTLFRTMSGKFKLRCRYLAGCGRRRFLSMGGKHHNCRRMGQWKQGSGELAIKRWQQVLNNKLASIYCGRSIMLKLRTEPDIPHLQTIRQWCGIIAGVYSHSTIRTHILSCGGCIFLFSSDPVNCFKQLGRRD